MSLEIPHNTNTQKIPIETLGISKIIEGFLVRFSPDVSPDFDKEKLREIIKQAFEELEQEDKRSADIFKERYELGKTLQKIGENHGVSRSRIDQIVRIALRKMERKIESKLSNISH